jgi:alpha-tubulin suppressor-like RCC1 family protein
MVWARPLNLAVTFAVTASCLAVCGCQAALGLDDFEFSSSPELVMAPLDEGSGMPPADAATSDGIAPPPSSKNPTPGRGEALPEFSSAQPVEPSEGGAGNADAGRVAGDAGAPTPPLPGSDTGGAPALGGACSPEGALACNGPSQKLQLVCTEERWEELGACSVGENCDRREGACAPIVAECAALAEDDRFCRGDALMRCGADLVSAPLLDACRNRCVGAEGGAECRVALAAGGLHNCALTDAGTLHCWGEGRSGQLGRGITDPIGDNESLAISDPINAGVGAAIVQLTAGTYHTCVLLEGGRVRCWGQNADGQLGYPDASFGDGQALADLPDVELGGRAVEVAAGGSHTCALLDDGSVRCWGDNGFAQLGQGDPELLGGPLTPTRLPAVNLGARAVQLSAGELHTCALLDDATVRCWGVNVDGQLGTGDEQSVGDDEVPASVPPVDVGGAVRQVAAGEHHSCALLDGGAVRCWGLGTNGLLGTNDFTSVGDDEPPVEGPLVALAEPAVRISARNLHSCALHASGTITCWGSGSFGQLGYGTTDPVGAGGSGTLPVLTFFERALDVVAGYYHTCALFDDGRVRCWGNAGNGQLGSGNTTPLLDASLASPIFLGSAVSL